MQYLIFAAIGGFAGLVRAVITGKGLILLPKLETKGTHKFLNLGVLTPLFIGCLAGWLAPYTLGVDSAVAALAGWAGTDMLENLIETGIGRGTGR